VTPAQLAVLIAVNAVLMGTAAGLVVRGRWRLSRVFTVYVPVVCACEMAVAFSPSRFFVPEFWLAKQAIYDVLKLGIALELAWKTFGVFPGARATSRCFALVIVSLTTFALIAAPADGANGDLFLLASGQLHPRVLNGTIWLMSATLILAQWYRVPLHPFHAAILASFASYLALFGALLQMEGLHGWTAQRYLNALDPPAYLVLVCWWLYIAWRPEAATAAAYDETIHRLKLRTVSCG